MLSQMPRNSAFGMCSSVRKLGFATQRAELLVPQGRRACTERLSEGAVLCHPRSDATTTDARPAAGGVRG